MRRAYSVGRLSRRAFAGGGVLSAAPDTRDLLIVAHGNSITATGPWPSLLEDMLIAGGKTAVVHSKGHGSYTTTEMGGAGKLIDTIAADVDALYDSSKACVLVHQEVINALKLGTSGADAYTNICTYLDAVADDWYVVVCSPTPRNDVGTPGGYETERQAFIAAVVADPTFGGRVDAIAWMTDDPDDADDTRLDDYNDTYYYNADKAHWLTLANALCAAKVCNALRSFLPIDDALPHLPYATVLQSTSGLLNGSGVAPSNGDGIASWAPVYSDQVASFAQAVAGSRPTYDATGAGGRPGIASSGAQYLSSNVGMSTTNRYTMAVVAKVTGGGWAIVAAGGTDTRLALNDGAVVTTYTGTGATYSIKKAASSDVVDSARHIFVATCNHTHATNKLYRDGSELTLANYDPVLYQGNPDGSASVTTTIFNNGSSMAGPVTDVVLAPIPYTPAERARLEALLA